MISIFYALCMRLNFCGSEGFRTEISKDHQSDPRLRFKFRSLQGTST